MLERLDELARQGLNVGQIAHHLNAEGFRPPKRTSRFTTELVGKLLIRHAIRTPGRRRSPAPEPGPDEWTVQTLANELAMPTDTVFTWIYRGWLTAAKPPGSRSWIISADAGELRRLRELRSLPRSHHARQRWQAPIRPQQPDEETP